MLYEGNGCGAMEKKILVEEGGRFEVQHHVGGWCSNEARGPYSVGLWKNIRIKLYLFSSFIRYDVGDDSKIFVGVTFGMVRLLLGLVWEEEMEWNGKEMNEKNNFRIFFPSLV